MFWPVVVHYLMKRDAGAMILLTRLESCHTALQSKAQEEPDKSGTSVCNI